MPPFSPNRSFLHNRLRRSAWSRPKPSAPRAACRSARTARSLFHLRRNGYTVVARRWRTARLRGDIDLIAWHGATLCIIEVKTRTRRDAGPAEMAVDADKQRTLRALARAYLRRLPANAREAELRFDVVSVYLEPSPQSTGPHFEINQGAFGWA